MSCSSTTRATFAVDLDYGPDGAVYIIDWVDRQHCHSPHEERWDRTNGRLYRLSYASTYKPRTVDLSKSSDGELAALQTHANAWYARTARRLLQERSATRDIDQAALATLRGIMAASSTTHALRAVWALHVVEALTGDDLRKLLASSNEYIRAWAVRLSTQGGLDNRAALEMQNLLPKMARTDPSSRVRLALASYLPDAPPNIAWSIAEALAAHNGDASDRYLPRMLWFGIAELCEQNVSRALDFTERCELPTVREFIWWHVAKSTAGLEHVLERLRKTSAEHVYVLLRAIRFARGDRPLLSTPQIWTEAAAKILRGG